MKTLKKINDWYISSIRWDIVLIVLAILNTSLLVLDWSLTSFLRLNSVIFLITIAVALLNINFCNCSKKTE